MVRVRCVHYGQLVDIEWAIDQVQGFIESCEEHGRLWDQSRDRESAEAERLRIQVMTEIPVIEDIADRAWPQWRDHKEPRGYMAWEYDPTLGLARKILVQLKRRDELAEKLGTAGPSLAAAALHPDVWQPAQSLWRSGHFGEAVEATARSVNAALQTKVGRRVPSGSALVKESFSLQAPKPGAPRLRVMEDDGSDTYKSLQQGAMEFGSGCFAAIRNVLSHEHGEAADLPEQTALEYLAAFSILARWIDSAERVDAPASGG